MTFILDLILGLITWPFRTFPKTTMASLILIAGGGAAMAHQLHDVGVNLGNDVCNVFVGHNCHVPHVTVPGRP